MMQKSLLLVLSFCIFAGSAFGVETGTLRKPIIDSKMSKKEVFDGLDPKCPPEIRKRQKIVKVKYYSFDGKVHQGQLVIDKDLVKDIKIIFKLALEIRFPIHSVIPVSHPDFRKNGRWDDDLSMIANNNRPLITGKKPAAARFRTTRMAAPSTSIRFKIPTSRAH